VYDVRNEYDGRAKFFILYYTICIFDSDNRLNIVRKKIRFVSRIYTHIHIYM
jgi:hypothetical protein